MPVAIYKIIPQEQVNDFLWQHPTLPHRSSPLKKGDTWVLPIHLKDADWFDSALKTRLIALEDYQE